MRSQVNILHVRALIKADTVILFDTYGSADSRLHSVFVYHLEVSAYLRLFVPSLTRLAQHNLRAKTLGLAYEFR